MYSVSIIDSISPAEWAMDWLIRLITKKEELKISERNSSSDVSWVVMEEINLDMGAGLRCLDCKASRITEL